MAERLGTGLQNLGQRFDSAWHLKKKKPTGFFFLKCLMALVYYWWLRPQTPALLCNDFVLRCSPPFFLYFCDYENN